MKIIELKIKNPKRIYQEVAQALAPYREKAAGSILFIVEGTKKNPIVGLRYPGKKIKKRNLKIVRSNSALWTNLYDFEVVPYKKGKELNTSKFTFAEMMNDFQENKKKSKKFWKAIEKVYKNNTTPKNLPRLPGIDSKLYLLMLKWIWIQEDFNYKFSWKDVNSPVRYVLRNKNDKPTSGGAGRAKFFAALVLLEREDFNYKEVKKIIPLY